MYIIKDFLIELKKHKRRFNLLIFMLIVVFEMFFIYGNYGNDKGLEDGWKILFYNMPIMNSLFLPIVIGAFASRLMDFEHKGDMLKCLYTFSTPARIFYSKFIYGALLILSLTVMQCAAINIMSSILGFVQKAPVKYMLFYGINTYITCMLLFCIHLLLAYFFKNQATSICVGLLGSFVGLFVSFLPQSLFQKLLPWGTFITAVFIRMDWSEESGIATWTITNMDFSTIIINICWIILITAFTLLLLKNSGVEETSHASKKSTSSTRLKLHKLPVEFMKLKGSPAWIAFFIIPLVSAIIGTLNYLGNIDLLTEGWYSLWTQHILFLCYFFMPVIISVFAGCTWRMEHNGTNMNLLLTHDHPVRIVLSKYFITCFITSISLVWVTVLYILAGKFCNISGSLPDGLLKWLLMGLLGAYSICALQIFLGLIIRSFILPVILAFIGGIIGLACLAKNVPYYTPFSLFDLAMNQADFEIDACKYLIAAIIFIVVFIILSILYLVFSDAKSNE